MDEERLVKLSLKGDDEAFYKLIDHNKEQLYRIAFSYLKNQPDSLEAIQETTYRAYKNLKKLKNVKYFKTWLIRVLINYCIDELQRKEKVMTLTKDVEDITDNSSDDKLTVEAAIGKLKPKYRQIVLLKYFEDLTIREISQVMQCPEGTIKTRLSRALESLRNHLNRSGAYHV